MDGDFSHGADADRRRAEKATALARFAWDRAISGPELLALPDDRLRKLARAAGVNPPSTRETWTVAAELLERKAAWAQRNPADPRSAAVHADEKIMWVKRPPPAWT